MMTRLSAFGLLALLLLVGGCAEEIEAPSDPWVGNEGNIDYVDDAFATAVNPSDTDGAQYQIYLPDGYSASGDPFPVVYMLHGYGGDEHMFPSVFSMTAKLDQLVAEGRIPPMVVVWPNGDSELGGSFYENSLHSTVNNSADHIMNIVAAVEAGYNVSTDAAGKGICGLSMGAYGSLSLALDNPGVWSHVGALSGPISHWGTRTLDPADMTYKGIEELLPAILAQTGYNPATDTPADYQTKMDPSLGPPTSMMFAIAAAYSPTLTPGPTTHATYGVDLPIGLDGEIDMATWSRWMERDIVNRIVNPDATINDAASLATFDLYMAVGLDDDLGLFGAHQVLQGVLEGVGFPPAVSRYFSADPNGIPAGHVEMTQAEMTLMLEWMGENLQ